MSQVLYAHDAQQYDDAKAAGWQAAQVSTISLTNFLGRIFIGTEALFLLEHVLNWLHNT
jgi:hypothetical protein